MIKKLNDQYALTVDSSDFHDCITVKIIDIKNPITHWCDAYGHPHEYDIAIDNVVYESIFSWDGIAEEFNLDEDAKAEEYYEKTAELTIDAFFAGDLEFESKAFDTEPYNEEACEYACDCECECDCAGCEKAVKAIYMEDKPKKPSYLTAYFFAK